MKRIIGILILITLLGSFFSGCVQNTGYTVINGRYVLTDSGDHMIIRETDSGAEEQILMTCSPHGEASFDGIQTGDRIRIKIVLIEEIDGKLTTEVFECKKIG